MEAYKFTGTLVWVGAIQRIKSAKSGNIFVKRDIGIAEDPDDQYPTVFIGTLKKSQNRDLTERVSEADVGRKCTVSFYPDGRFYNDKQTGEKKAIGGNSVVFIELETGTAAESPSAEDLDQDGDMDEDMPF